MTPLSFALSLKLWTVLLPLAVNAPDPDKVKPGWLGFSVVLVLGAAVAFLGFSLRKHLNRVNFEEKPDDPPKSHPAS